MSKRTSEALANPDILTLLALCDFSVDRVGLQDLQRSSLLTLSDDGRWTLTSGGLAAVKGKS